MVLASSHNREGMMMGREVINTMATSFVEKFKAGTPLAKASLGLTSQDQDASDDFVVYVFRDGSKAGYKRGNNSKKSQAWVIAG